MKQLILSSASADARHSRTIDYSADYHWKDKHLYDLQTNPAFDDNSNRSLHLQILRKYCGCRCR